MDDIIREGDWTDFDADWDGEWYPDPARMCGRCYAEDVDTFPADCAEKPEKLLGAPLGMYHCPDCGAMVVAGVPHPNLCKQCLDGTHPGFTEWDSHERNRRE